MFAVRFIALLALVVPAFAGRSPQYGDLRIFGGGNSGRLEFRKFDGSWGTVCDDGFDGDAGKVACHQLGYNRLSKVGKHKYNNFNDADLPIAVCYTDCGGYEKELTHCSLAHCSGIYYCSHYEDVAITCTNELSTGAIIGIVFGVLFFIGCVAACIGTILCCCIPSCGWYYKGHDTRRSTYTPAPAYHSNGRAAATTNRVAGAPPPYSAATQPKIKATTATTQPSASPVVIDNPTTTNSTESVPAANLSTESDSDVTV